MLLAFSFYPLPTHPPHPLPPPPRWVGPPLSYPLYFSLPYIVILGSGINIILFCFRPKLFWPKRKRSAIAKKKFDQFKMFCFDLHVFVLTRNVPLCIRRFPDHIKLFSFVPESLGQYRNDLLLINFFLDQIKMFCSDLSVFLLHRNVPLRLRQFLDQITLVHFIPEPMGQNGNELILI